MALTDDTFDLPGMGKEPRSIAVLLLLPLLLWLALFVVAPTLIMAFYSFGQPDERLGRTEFSAVNDQGVRESKLTLQNYRKIFDAPQLLAIGLCVLAGVGAGVLGRRLTRMSWMTRAFAGQYDTHIIVILTLLAFWLPLNVYALVDWSATDFGIRHREDLTSWTAWFLQVKDRSNNLKIMVISVNYAAISTAICVVAGYPVAYFIGRAPGRTRNLLLMAVMIPFWTSFLVRTYAWITIFRNLRSPLESLHAWLNNLLVSSHVLSAPTTLFQTDLFPSEFAVMVGLVYTYLPFMILPIYTSIERLDNAMVEAALDLGASPVRAFQNVIFPLTRPGVTAGVMLVFVPAVGQFAVNYILSGGKQELIGTVIQKQFGSGKNMPFGSALGMLLLAIFCITYYLMTRRRAPV